MTSDKPKKEIKEFDEKFIKLETISTQTSDTVNVIIGLLNRYVSKIRTNKDIELSGSAKIKFKGFGSNFEFYRETGDSGKLVIDSDTDTENSIRIGETKKPLDVYIYGTDECLIGANNNTKSSYLLVEPNKAGFFTNTTDEFTFRLPNLANLPATCLVGELAVKGGKAYICSATNTWTVIGTQT